MMNRLSYTTARFVEASVRYGFLALFLVSTACGADDTCSIETAADGSQAWVCPDGKRVELDGPRDGCSVRENPDGSLSLVCADGTEVEIPAGSRGGDGKDGKDGADGKDGLPGLDGRDGRPGSDGADGKNGKDGKDGKDGEDGRSPLIRIVPEPAGERCPNGGFVVWVGEDLDGDGILDLVTEATASEVICNGQEGPTGPGGEDGAPGEDGRDGEDGTAWLVRLAPEPRGANCPFAGSALHTGPDRDGDGFLSNEEIEQTRYVCNPADHRLHVQFTGLTQIETGARSLVGFHAMLSGTFDPFRPLRWEIRITRAEDGSPVSGVDVYQYVPAPPAAESGNEDGPEGPVGDDPDDHTTWSGRLTTNEEGVVELTSPVAFTVREARLHDEGLRVPLSLALREAGEFTVTVSLLAVDDGELVGEVASAPFLCEGLESGFVFVGLDELVPGLRQAFMVASRLDRGDVETSRIVRYRYRLTSAGMPAEGVRLYGSNDLGIPPEQWTTYLEFDGQGQIALSPQQAGELQQLHGITHVWALALPAGNYRLEVEILDDADEEILAGDAIDFTVADTETSLDLFLSGFFEEGRMYLRSRLELGTTHPSSDPLRLELVLHTADGVPVSGATFFHGGGSAEDHVGWTARITTDSSGIAVWPQPLDASSLKGPEGLSLAFSLAEPPNADGYELGLRLVSEADGSIVAETSDLFWVD